MKGGGRKPAFNVEPLGRHTTRLPSQTVTLEHDFLAIRKMRKHDWVDMFFSYVRGYVSGEKGWGKGKRDVVAGLVQCCTDWDGNLTKTVMARNHTV